MRFLKRLFLYKALQRQANLVANSEGIAIDGEVGICLHFLEKEVEGAVVPTRERDVLAVEEARISLQAVGGSVSMNV